MIADIGGYTNYMRLHRVGLAHAQANIARLLEAVIDAVPDLELIEIEGDAAFLSSPRADESGAADAATQAAARMHRAFHTEQGKMVALNLCSCSGCVQAGQLRLKCVAHVDEVAEQTIRDRTKLVGVDVILVHRLLKNPVPIEEYVLLSDELHRTGDADLRERAVAVEQELEGLGRVQAFFLDLGDIGEPLPPPPRPSLPRRLGHTLGVMGKGMPYMLGLRH